MGKKSRRRLTKERVARWLDARFFVRFHMSLILTATFLAGLGATKLLLLMGVSSLALRYVAAVCAAYLVFLALIRLWLFYVGADRQVEIDGEGIDLFFTTAGEGVEALNAGGGSFGGGGATGAWGDAAAAPAKAAASKSSSSGFNFDFDLDFDAAVVVVLFIALIGSLFIVGIYLIYTAPALLSEAAFEAFLTAALLRRAKKIDGPGWVGTVWRATLWPFLLIVVLAGGLGWAARRHCPEAETLREAMNCQSRAGAGGQSR
jgi:hypothetical protein